MKGAYHPWIEKKQGMAIVLSLPMKMECGTREFVLDELRKGNLNSVNGMENLVHFLTPKFRKDEYCGRIERL